MSARAPIVGSTLRWAREILNLEQQQLARAMQVPPERLTAFETGESLPTLKQLFRAANKLERTPAFFFLDAPVAPDVPQTNDFRGQHSGEPLPYDLKRDLLKAGQNRRALLGLEPKPKSDLPSFAITRESAPQQAAAFREYLGVDEDFVPQGKSSDALLHWRHLIEERTGALVFETSNLERGRLRGLSVYYEEYPLIFLNGKDALLGKIFTLFHEVAHILNRKSAHCLLEEEVKAESVCNAFAANCLMPEAAVTRVLADLAQNPHAEDGGTSDEINAIDDISGANDDAQRAREEQVRIGQIAKAFQVSELAAGIRLREFGLVSAAALELTREKSERAWESAKVADANADKKAGYAERWRIAYRNLSHRYIGAVLDAWEEERIDILEAAHLLKEKIPTTEKILDACSQRGKNQRPRA